MSSAGSGLLGRGADPKVAAWAARTLGLAALVLVVAWVARSGSVVGDDRLLAASALAVLSVAWLAFLLPVGLDRRLQVAALLVVGTCAAILNHLRPNSPAFLAALLAMAGAAVRLPVGWALTVMAAATVAITLSEGVGATHTIPAGVSYTAAAAVLFGVATYVRTLREAHRRAERIVVELQATRRAEAKAAALGERARLAREMHDILAHVLSALSLQLEAMALLLQQEGASDRALRQVERAQRLARDGLDEAQEAIGALRGDRLPGLELLPRLVEDFRQATGVPARLEVAGEPWPLGHEAGLAVYRTAQEALTNVRKHARTPADVAVALGWQPDGLALTVVNRDADGRPPPGADPAAADPAAADPTGTDPTGTDPTGADPTGADPTGADGQVRGGYGLTGMRERAELLGGELVACRTADGFQVRLWLPA
jgi:signal transduction histidine kinase